jgi:L-asparaginase / beta-aspartyl-peptidase
MKYSIALHGGAGTILPHLMTPEKEEAYKNGLKNALLVGEQLLKDGKTALDAVEATVKSLEDNPLFNAGRGSVFTHQGTHEMDASIMNGIDKTSGAVAGIKGVKNPISLARKVMEQTEHVLLAGNGAQEFAISVNEKMEDESYFFDEFRFEQYQQALQYDGVFLDHSDDKFEQGEKKFGTVGAVALDSFGNIAAATSTGGMTNKKFGRLGDSPIIGAGTFADNTTCAVSCTGHGEFFLRAVVAYDISCLMAYKGMTLKEAANYVVKDKLVKFGGEGGIIAVDVHGDIQMIFNTEGMYRASKSSSTDYFIAIYK